MNQKHTALYIVAALLSAACAWGQGASSGMSGTYANIEAGTLRKRPQDAWARSIAFTDQIAAGEAGKSQRLDRRVYVPLELKSAGTAWVREDLYGRFAALPADTEFTFGGTVDQFNRRYYLILDAAYQVEMLPTQEERWTNVLDNPPVAPVPDVLPDETAADLPVAAQDADEVPSWGDVMSGIVEITDPEPEPAPVEEPVAEVDAGPVAEEEAEVVEVAAVDEHSELPAEGPAAEDEEYAEPPALPIEVAEVPPAVESVDDFGDFDFDEADLAAVEAEEPAAEPETPEAVEIAEAPVDGSGDDFGFDSFEEAVEEPVAEIPEETALAAETEPLEVETEEEGSLEEVAEGEGEVVEDFFDVTEGEIAMPEIPAEEVVEEVDSAEVFPEPQTAVPEVAEVADDDSWHVGPMDDPAPIALVPLVSLQPTKAELAAQEERRREEERQAKIEAKRQREEEAKRAKAEAAARKKADAEARAELERARKEAEEARRAEEQRLREEEVRALEAMEAREVQEREAAAQAAAREALQKEYDELAARVEANRAELAERTRMAQEVIAVEQAAREEAERAAREDAERQEELRAGKERLEADLAEVAERQAEVEQQLAAEQAAREEAERIAREEAERAEELAAQERAAAEELAAARAAAEEQAAAERAARKAAKKAAKRAAREAAAAERAAAEAAAEEAAAEVAELDATPAGGDVFEEEFFAEEIPEMQPEDEIPAAAVAVEPVVTPAPAPAPKARDDIPDWMKPVVF